MAKIYDLTIPRKYKDANGNEKTHFWQVGTMFPLKERDGFSIKLNSRWLMTDQYVAFARDEKDAPADPQTPVDDIPF